jgi:uncharacterized protein (DUF2267 family)
MDEHTFLRDVSSRLACDERRAEAVTFAVFQELHDRLTPAERHDVASQLPKPLVRLWSIGPRADAAPPSSVDRDEFIGRVRQRAVLPDDGEAERAVRAVFATLQRALAGPDGSGGEGADVASQLPKRLKRLWVEAGTS